MSEIIIGIDLGTTNSEVAIVKDGKTEVITDEGKKMLPSFVGLDDSGQVIVGEIARNQYLVYPERTVKSIKRLMGQDTHVVLGDQSYTPQEISAIILKRLKTIAEKHVGKIVNKAVKTNPAALMPVELLIQLKVAKKDWEGTRNAIEQLKKTPKSRLVALYWQGVMEAMQGRIDVAMDRYRDVLVVQPNNFDMEIVQNICYGRRKGIYKPVSWFCYIA